MRSIHPIQHARHLAAFFILDVNFLDRIKRASNISMKRRDAMMKEPNPIDP